MKPQLWVIAGPNGAGKSTLANSYLLSRLPVVNPDDIAREHPGIGPIRAGRLAVLSQRNLLTAGESFAWETTLSGNRELPFMREAKAIGYKVNFVFVGLRDPYLSMLRVSERVASGGHRVPQADVFRRFERSLQNFREAFAIAGRAFIFDNTGKRRRLLLSQEHGQVKHKSRNMPIWAKGLFGNCGKHLSGKR